MSSVDEAVNKYVVALAASRDRFVALHSELAALHPKWVPMHDARTALVAKPINLLLSAIANPAANANRRCPSEVVGDLRRSEPQC